VPIGLVAPARDAAHFTLSARGSGVSRFRPRCARSRSTPATSALAGEVSLFDDGASSRRLESNRAAAPARRNGRALSRRGREHRPEHASRESGPEPRGHADYLAAPKKGPAASRR
jgi:hypothetical protein